MIGHNTHKGRISHIHSKTTPIYGPVHKCDFNYFYSRIHFSWLPQAFAKNLIYSLPQKFSYSYKVIDTVILWFGPNEVTSHLHICDHSIATFVIRRLYLGFSKTPHVDSLDRFIKSVADHVKTDVCIFFNHSKENNIKYNMQINSFKKWRWVI